MKRHRSCFFSGLNGKRQTVAVLWGAMTIAAIGVSACSTAEIVDRCNNRCLDGEICQADGVCRILCLPDGTCRDPQLTCQDGLCKSKDELLCRIGTLKCSSDNRSVLRCGNSLQFELKETCQEGFECNAGQCVEGSCVDGSLRCSSGNVEKCISSGYTVYTQCEAPQRCDPSTFECLVPPECVEGDKRCRDDDVDICVDGIYQSYKRCPEGQACDGATLECAAAAECVNGAKECVGDDYRECQNGRWHMKKCPGGFTCSGNGECTQGACKDGDTRCAENDGKGVVETCKDGVYSVARECASQTRCQMTNDGAACVSTGALCASQRYRCVSNALQQCDESTGTYKIVEQCSATQVCSATNAKCESLCGNGVIDANAGEECDSDKIMSNATCESMKGTGYHGSLSCNALTCKIDTSNCSRYACSDGEKLCVGSVFKSCSNGEWTSYDCSNDGKICVAQVEGGCYKQDVSTEYDFIQNFENYSGWTETEAYGNTFTDELHPPVVYEFMARTNTYHTAERNLAISGRSIILRQDNKNYFKVTNIQQGIAKLSFKWRKWKGDDASAELELFVEDNLVATVDTSVNSEEVQTYTIDIPPEYQSAGSFTLQPNVRGSRLVLDDIMWSNK